MKVSIIIPTYKRVELLKWGLESLADQQITYDFETIILNDGIHDETEAVCEQYKEKLNIKYIFTGQRNLQGRDVWRVPGYAINIGVKHSDGDVILLCCAEMFHMSDTVDMFAFTLSQPEHEKSLVIPKAKDDNGAFLNDLNRTGEKYNFELFNSQPPLENVKFPFCLAMKRERFMEIGGYDEDFTGTDYDDSDLVGRLLANGCTHEETEALVIHLWHPRLAMTADRIPRFEHNKKLYEDKQGIIIRNIDREWGVL